MIEDVNTLQQIRSYINTAANLIKTQPDIDQLPTQKHQPSNKLIEQQRHFFSTKRKRKSAAVRIAKPTLKEKNDICTALLSTNTTLYPSGYEILGANTSKFS